MRAIDLEMRITPSIRVFLGLLQPSFIRWSKFDSRGYDSEAMFMSTHTDTHMDAPSHFVPGLDSIDKILAGRLECSAVSVKVPRKANQLVEQQDFEDIKIQQGDAVVISTGGEKRAAKTTTCLTTPTSQVAPRSTLQRKRSTLSRLTARASTRVMTASSRSTTSCCRAIY